MSNLWGSYYQKLEVLTEGKTSAEDLDYAVHVSLKYKYIFVETPKVACSTIKTTLQRLELEAPDFERENFEDLHVRDFSPLLRLQQLPDFENFLEREDFHTFCFVRNPYSRLLSCYLDKIKNPTEVFSFKEKVLKKMGLDEKNIEHVISFEEFIEVIENQSPLEMDYHWRPQTYLTCQGRITYDVIGRLEAFDKDFSAIGNTIARDFKKYYEPEIRHKTDATNLLDKYYNTELLKRVYTIYEMDFVNFSYEQ